MPKIGKIRDLGPDPGGPLRDPKIGSGGVPEGRKWSENPKIRKKKCENFPKFVENGKKTAFFRPFYGAPRPRKWEKYLRTPRSLGGHLYAPAPKQWSIGAPPGFPGISRKIGHFRVNSGKSGVFPRDPFRTPEKAPNRRKLPKIGENRVSEGVQMGSYRCSITGL